MQAQGGKVIVREKLLYIPRKYNCALRRRGARVPPERYNCTRAPPTRRARAPPKQYICARCRDAARAYHLNNSNYTRAPTTRRARAMVVTSDVMLAAAHKLRAAG